MKPLRELPMYKEMLEEGRAEGREEAQKEIREQELAMLRQLLLKVVKVQMPELSKLARKQAALIDSPEVLSDLLIKLVTTRARAIKEVEHYMLTWNEPAEKQKSV